jgi:hypothetical protein
MIDTDTDSRLIASTIPVTLGRCYTKLSAPGLCLRPPSLISARNRTAAGSGRQLLSRDILFRALTITMRSGPFFNAHHLTMAFPDRAGTLSR